MKARFAAEQLAEFGQLEDRYARAIMDDLQHLSRLGEGRASEAATGTAAPALAGEDGEPEEPQSGRGIRHLYAEWLAVRARLAFDAENDDDAHNRENEITRAIMAMPSECAVDVFRKIEIIEHYVSYEGEPTEWEDSREVVMPASMRADLTRLRPGEPPRRR